MSDLRRFFWPRSIAVIGASPDPSRLGGRLLKALVLRGYPGRLYAVNPNYSEIQGLPGFSSVAAIDDAIDLALVIVRAEIVADTLEACAEKGVKAAVVFSSGFAEAGEAWADAQDRIAGIGRRTGMLIAGPNAEGYYNARGCIAATFSPTVEFAEEDDRPIVRKLGIVAQSGGLGFALMSRAMAKHLGVNYVISSGNEAALESSDFADFMIEEEGTEVLLMFVEGFRDGRKFVGLAEKAADLGKPLIVTKVGRTEAGARAARSHTATMAGEASSYDAVFDKYGVVRVDDQDEMIDVAAAFALNPLPRGPRVAVLTTSGGTGVWLADTLERHGLTLPVLSEGTQARLRELMPHYGASQNPVDVTAQASRGGGLFRALDILLEDDGIDMVALAGPMASASFVEEAGEPFREMLARAAKPVLVYSYSLPPESAIDRLAEAGVYCYTTLRGVALAARSLADYAGFRVAWAEDRPLRAGRPAGAAFPDVSRYLDGAGDALCEYEVMELLKDCGLLVSDGRLASSAAEAAAAAEALGFPVALKIQSPDIAHKAQVGGVRLGLADAQAVIAVFDELLDQVQKSAPKARIRGVLVQRMSGAGRELMAGIYRDPGFGPLILAGAGGTDAEATGDWTFAPVPLTPREARAMIARLSVARLLNGGGGAPPSDIDAFADLLVTLSHLAAAWGDLIGELDLNPVFVHPRGEGVTIADGLLIKA